MFYGNSEVNSKGEGIWLSLDRSWLFCYKASALLCVLLCNDNISHFCSVEFPFVYLQYIAQT